MVGETAELGEPAVQVLGALQGGRCCGSTPAARDICDAGLRDWTDLMARRVGLCWRLPSWRASVAHVDSDKVALTCESYLGTVPR